MSFLDDKLKSKKIVKAVWNLTANWENDFLCLIAIYKIFYYFLQFLQFPSSNSSSETYPTNKYQSNPKKNHKSTTQKSQNMLSPKHPIPNRRSNSKPSVRIPKMMFHMIPLQLANKGQVKIRPKMKIIMQDIIQDHQCMSTHQHMQCFTWF